MDVELHIQDILYPIQEFTAGAKWRTEAFRVKGCDVIRYLLWLFRHFLYLDVFVRMYEKEKSRNTSCAAGDTIGFLLLNILV